MATIDVDDEIDSFIKNLKMQLGGGNVYSKNVPILLSPPSPSTTDPSCQLVIDMRTSSLSIFVHSNLSTCSFFQLKLEKDSILKHFNDDLGIFEEFFDAYSTRFADSIKGSMRVEYDTSSSRLSILLNYNIDDNEFQGSINIPLVQLDISGNIFELLLSVSIAIDERTHWSEAQGMSEISEGAAAASNTIADSSVILNNSIPKAVKKHKRKRKTGGTSLFPN